MHVTFRKKYLGKVSSTETKMLAKKTSKDIFKFKIDPAVQDKEIEKLDKDKPLLYLEKHHKTNLSCDEKSI